MSDESETAIAKRRMTVKPEIAAGGKGYIEKMPLTLENLVFCLKYSYNELIDLDN